MSRQELLGSGGRLDADEDVFLVEASHHDENQAGNRNGVCHRVEVNKKLAKNQVTSHSDERATGECDASVNRYIGCRYWPGISTTAS